MKYFFQTYFIFLVIISFTSCSNKNNEKTYLLFENEFNKNIIDNNAKAFEFEYDGLVPQNSYFIESKLKFLKYSHRPENGNIESLVYFDINSDSLKKIIRRKINFEWDDNKNERTEKYSDTIHLILFEKNKTYTYFDNKIIDSIFKKDIYETDIKFIKAIKSVTEKKQNHN